MKVLRGVGVDIGGSQNRIKPLDATETEITQLESDFMTIDQSKFRVRETSKPEELCHIVKAPKEEFLGIVARGLTGKMYDGSAMSFTSQTKKTESINYYRQLIFTLATDALHGLQASASDNVEFLYAMTICIPIREYAGNKDYASLLKQQVAGDYEVTFPLIEGCPKVRFTLKDNYIGVMPEGGIAITALKKQLMDDEISVLIDMGEVTMDYGLYQGTELLGKVISSPFAGSTLKSNICMALSDEGFIVSEDQMDRVMRTSSVRQGATEVNVTNIIDEQKKLFVDNYIKPELTRLLNSNKINSQQVQNIVPVGAAMNSDSRGVSKIITGVQYSCGMEHANIKMLADDLRFVNVNMATRFSKFVVARAIKEMDAVAM